MISTAQALVRYGEPERELGMVLWDVPVSMEIGTIPKRIYCNKDLRQPLEYALRNILERGLIKELKSWDGCFNIRKKRAGRSLSLHSWGLAVDVNAGWNRFGHTPTLSTAFVKCFTDAGFAWGGLWRKPDGMHFELARLPDRETGHAQ